MTKLEARENLCAVADYNGKWTQSHTNAVERLIVLAAVTREQANYLLSGAGCPEDLDDHLFIIADDFTSADA